VKCLGSDEGGGTVELLRIGDKVLSMSKIYHKINTILETRSKGFSQQETAERLGVDRTFISRLESLGEIRKGKSIGVIGFPILNKDEIQNILDKYGIVHYFLLTERERCQYITEKSGLELFNNVMTLLSEFRNLDTVIVMGSDKRIKLIQALLDNQVIPFEIGTSPITQDVHVNPGIVKTLIETLTQASE